MRPARNLDRYVGQRGRFQILKFNRAREDVRVSYDRQSTYKDGSTKLIGVTVVTTERGGARTFTVSAKEGLVGQDESLITMNGDVNFSASDGLTAKTEHATYNQTDGGWEWEPSKEAELRGRGDTAIALHDLRKAGFSPVGHGSVANPMLVDGRGKSVRVAWSNNAEDKRIVDDLIAYLLSL